MQHTGVTEAILLSLPRYLSVDSSQVVVGILAMHKFGGNTNDC